MPQVFDLHVNATDDYSTSDIWLNGVKLDFKWDASRIVTRTPQEFSVSGTSGRAYHFAVSVGGLITAQPQGVLSKDNARQDVTFTALLCDGQDCVRWLDDFTFVATIRPTAETRRLEGIFFPPRFTYEKSEASPSSKMIEFMDSLDDSPTSDIDDGMPQLHQTDIFDLAAELESLRLLQAQAHDLHSQVTAKQQHISNTLRQHREKLCLKHLIMECDGVICAAKAIAQRLCDKVGIHTTPSFGYNDLQKNTHDQHMAVMTSNEKTPFHSNKSQASIQSLLLTKNGSTPSLHPIDLVTTSNPVVRVLEVIATVLGLSLLFRFIRRKCMSLRKRAERAADLEERRNQRAYRRAARRALVRKRWDNFVGAINCFRVCHDEPRMEDYEEKRALILQDAFLEQELDQAEKGEVMEAEIRELRYAHEIVSSLVRVDENRYELITPVNDPPPPLVPLPYTPVTRSRASTGTLPSYTSESLPDYTSRPGGEESSSSGSVVDGFTPSMTTSEEDSRAILSPTSETSTRTRYTPTSSVLEMSPRVSDETLRTRPSRPSGDTF